MSIGKQTSFQRVLFLCLTIALVQQPLAPFVWVKPPISDPVRIHEDCMNGGDKIIDRTKTRPVHVPYGGNWRRQDGSVG